jgi:hypothetical protein
VFASSDAPDTSSRAKPYSLDLDQYILRQPGDLDTASGWLGIPKELGVVLVDGRKVFHGFEEDDAFEYGRGRRAGSFEDGRDILEDLGLGVSVQL